MHCFQQCNLNLSIIRCRPRPMPIIHFAFGNLHRETRLLEQLDSFVEHILLPRKLKSSDCPEFVPIISKANSQMAMPDSAYDTGNGVVSFCNWIQSPIVLLRPDNVPMISFVDIAFKKLKHWSPHEHYGRLGLVFTNNFRSKKK